MSNTYGSQSPANVGGPVSGKVKPKSKAKTVTAPTPTTYTWANGSSGHSISQAAHVKNVAAKIKANALVPYDLGSDSIYGDPTQVRNSVNAAADVKYGQPILTQQQQIAASQQRQNVDLPGWWKQYQDTLAQSRANSAAQWQAAAGANAPAAAQSTGDPLADAAAANRASMQNAFADMMRSQGASTTSNYDNQIAQAPLLQLGMVNREALNGQNLQAQLGQLQQEKGEYANQTLADYRTNQSKYSTDMAAAQAAEAAATGQLPDGTPTERAREFNATLSANNDKFNGTLNSLGYTNGEWAKMSSADRTAARKAQEKPAKAAAENTKDYYGHTWSEWKALSPAQRRSAMNLAAKAKDTGTTDKPTFSKAGQAANDDAFHYALDWYRKNPKKWQGKSNAITTVTTTGQVTGTTIPYAVAKIVDHWARNNGNISQAEYDTLVNYGISPSELAGHVK